MHDRDARQLEPLDEIGGAVGRAVVHDDDLEVGVVAGGERTDCLLDPDRLVEGGHDDRDRRREGLLGRPAADDARVAPGEGEQEDDAGDEEPRDEDEQQAEGGRRPARGRERREEQPSSSASPAPGRELDLRSRQARKLGDRDEPEAARA